MNNTSTFLNKGVKLLAMVLGLLYFSGCKPEPLPDVIDEEPLFKVVGTIGNEPLDIAAGVDDYYLDSHFEQDSAHIFTFGATFKKANCTSCTESLSINLRDRKVTAAGDNFIRDLSLRLGEYPISELQSFPNSLETSMIWFFPAYVSDPNISDFYLNYNPNYEFQWIFNGIDTTTLPTPIYKFPDSGGTQTAELIVTNTVDGCEDHWLHEEASFISACTSRFFAYNNNSSGTVEFILPFPDIISSSWDFGNNQTGQYGAVPVISTTYTDPDTYEVCVDAQFMQCSDQFCSRVQSHRGEGCAAGFYYAESPTEGYFFSTVNFSWVASNGTAYSSMVLDALQPPDSFFEVLEIEPFNNNPNGEKTVKITATLKVTLFNTNDKTDSIVLETENLIFAVAYPDI